MKKIMILSILALALLSVTGCFAETFTGEGLSLSIPDEYAELLTVTSGENGRLFSVYENESLEAAGLDAPDAEGLGWLFSIGRVSEDEGHQMMCNDISGREFFAKDGDGNYYVYYHPTDVRMVRKDYSDKAATGRWTMLCEWANTVSESFTAENEGLTAFIHGSSILEVFLSRILYMDDVEYTVSTTEFGPIPSGKVDAAKYITPLNEGVRYEYLDGEAPDGEYVVLNLPKDDTRFDFFLAEGSENIIRQVWFNEQNEMLYKAEFEDETIKASEVMNDFYHAMAEAQDAQ